MTRPSHAFHIAGVLISAAPGRVADVSRNLAAVPGLQVHAGDNRTGRIVTLETASIEEQEAQFSWVRTLREVRAVDLVCHYFEP
jgi:nitrate reductase NapAB chaperone NapD